MKVLVTGGSGFLGGAIVERLRARGDEVVALSRTGETRGDVADAARVDEAMRGCAAVVHTAARVGSWGREDDFVRTNVVGTQNVIDACARHRARLVYTSTPSVVSSDGDLEGVDETHAGTGRYLASYPRTKAEAERRVLAAGGVALRPHLMWGPGDTQLVPRLLAKARAGRVVLPSGPDKLVDCTYIDDAVDAHVLALDSRIRGRAYFVSQGEPVPSRWLVNRVLAAHELPPVTRTLPPSLLYALGAAFEASYRLVGRWDREPPITRFVAHELCTAHWFDISAARRDLGYAPKRTIEEGMRQLAYAEPTR